MSAFRTVSHFTQTEEERKASRELPRALFASTTAGYQGDVVEIKTGQLRSWWHDIDDALLALESGKATEYADAVSYLERLKDTIDGLIRSPHGQSVHSDRDSR